MTQNYVHKTSYETILLHNYKVLVIYDHTYTQHKP